MNLIKKIQTLFMGKTEEKKDDGVKVIYEASEEHDPRELKGTKLADCTFQTGCTTLA